MGCRWVFVGRGGADVGDWRREIQVTYVKCSFGRVSKTWFLLDKKTSLLLYQVLILSILGYHDTVYICVYRVALINSLYEMQNLLNVACHIPTNIAPMAHWG